MATRTTNNLVRTSLATQLFPKTSNIIAFAQMVLNAGALIIVKFAPQMLKNAITVKLQDTLQRSDVSPKIHSPKHQNLRKQMSIRLMQTPTKVKMKNLSITKPTINNSMIKSRTLTTIVILTTMLPLLVIPRTN